MKLKRVDIANLPNVALADVKTLPNCSAVYFVTDAAGRMLYIGATCSLTRRWSSHHKRSELLDIDNVKVFWLETPQSELVETERRYIATFRPLLNHVGNTNNTYKVRSVGGSLVVTLPQSILRRVPLVSGDEVSFTVAGAGNKDGPLIVIKPERVKPKKNGAKKR